MSFTACFSSSRAVLVAMSETSFDKFAASFQQTSAMLTAHPLFQ